MSVRGLGARAAVAGALVSGCSFGSFQTAHTQPRGTLSVTPGITQVFNRIDEQHGRSVLTNVGAQVGGRVGITERFDAGLGTFFLSGVKLDAKVNVLDPHQKFALAPRLGGGYRAGREIWLAEAGAITSYRASESFEPYLGLTFANHWIEPKPPNGPLPRDVVGRKGSGDGLLQLSLGAELVLSRHVSMLAEYGHWFVLNDDPGDYYRFVPTNVAGLALRIGSVRR